MAPAVDPSPMIVLAALMWMPSRLLGINGGLYVIATILKPIQLFSNAISSRGRTLNQHAIRLVGGDDVLAGG